MKFREVLEITEANYVEVRFSYAGFKVRGLFSEPFEEASEKEKEERERLLNMRVTNIYSDEESTITVVLRED